MKISIKTISALTFISLSLSLNPVPALAFSFDPNNIISDADFTNAGSMNLDAIQVFLETNGGTLGNFVTSDAQGSLKRASEIIFEAARKYSINPRVLLVKLQKEQSLVTNPKPAQKDYDWAMGYAVCDSCSKDDPLLQKFKGFGVQLDRAAWRLRNYIDDSASFNFLPGVTRSVDGIPVTPANQATANLYNYTPHLRGNQNFWRLWNGWFSKSYPDGSLIREEGSVGVWLIQDGKRRPILSKSVLKSRFPNAAVIAVSRNDLERFEIGYPLKYPNYTIASSSAGDIYLLVNNEKKKIASPEDFRLLGYNPEEVVTLADDELSWYRDGRLITATSAYPGGALLQDAKSGGVFFVEDGIKYPIWSKEILVANFGKRKISRVATDVLASFPTGQPLKLPDGTLIQKKGAPGVYVISNGEKRPIANKESFEQLHYDKKAIVAVNDKTLDAHPDGEPVNLLIPSAAAIASN